MRLELAGCGSSLLGGALSRSALHSLDVEDRHRAGLQPDPASGGKIGERLVDRLARGAHQLRELFLSQVVVHVHTVLTFVSEPLRQFKELLGDPARNVGEDQIRDHIVRAPEPRGQLTEQTLCDLWPVVEPRNQLIVFQGPQLTRRNRCSCSRSRSRIKNRQFAEHLSGSEYGQQVLTPRGSAAA
jgi:hypothetical protein